MKKIFLLFLTGLTVAQGQTSTTNVPANILNGGVTPTPSWRTVTNSSSTWTLAAHGYSVGDPVVFSTTGTLPTLSGNDYFEDTTFGPIAVLMPGRVYYINTVPDANTFTLRYYATGGAVSLTGTGTGTHSVNKVIRRNLVLGVNSTGAIQAQAADSLATGGNARGNFALDLQRGRESATQVASADYSTILNGFNNKISYTALAGSVYGNGSTILGGRNNHILNGNASVLGGQNNTLTGTTTGFAFGERLNVYMGSSQGFTAFGSQHLGGGADAFFGGGFHNLINGYGTTDLGTTGAQIGAVGSGTALTGAGGSNMQAFGAGVHAYWTGCEFRSNHANKDKAMIRGNLIVETSGSTAMGTIANGGTRTNELYMMGYYPDSVCQQATDINTGTDVFTGISTALTASTAVRVISTDDLPAPLVADTTYYIKSPSGTTFQLSATAGGAAIDITTTGTGVLGVTQYFSPTSNGPRWCRLFPSKLYTLNFTIEATLKSATTPTYAVWQRRVTYLQGSTIPSEPTLVGSVQTVGTDVGSNAGSPPASWTPNFTVATDGLHVSVTILNNDGAARNVHATAAFEAVEINTL